MIYLPDPDTFAARAFIPGNAQDERDLARLRELIAEGAKWQIIHINLRTGTKTPEGVKHDGRTRNT